LLYFVQLSLCFVRFREPFHSTAVIIVKYIWPSKYSFGTTLDVTHSLIQDFGVGLVYLKPLETSLMVPKRSS
jgi:hypothetical protein